MHSFFIFIILFCNVLIQQSQTEAAKITKVGQEIFMQMYYVTEVQGLSVYLPYPNKRNFTVNQLHKGKKLLA